MSVYHVISQMQADYARAIDNGDYERWPSFFEEECLYRVTTAANYAEGLEAALIYADSKGMLTDRIAALREANIYEDHSYRHILGQPFITSQDGDVVNCETAFLVARIMRTGETAVFVTGRYIDRVRVAGDSAKLIERAAVCDSSRIDTLLVLPL